MNETVDGEYQAMKARDGAYVREKFFGKSPEALELVSSMSDKDIWRLNRVDMTLTKFLQHMIKQPKIKEVQQ